VYFKEGKLVGISIDFWKLWEEKTGHQVELIPVEWAKAHEIMKAKQADVIDMVFYTEKRDEYLDFTRPFFFIPSSVYYRKNLHLDSLSDLSRYVVGAKESDALIDQVLSVNPSVRFQTYPDFVGVVIAAYRGEIDVFVMTDPSANYYLARYDLLDEFSRFPFPEPNAAHLATWERNATVLALLNEGLAKFNQEELDSLLDRYLVKKTIYPPWLLRVLLGGGIAVFVVVFLLSFFGWLLKRRVEERTKELVHVQKELEMRHEELTVAYEELATQNEELEVMYRELEKSHHNFLETARMLSRLVAVEIEERSFLEDLLGVALRSIPKTRYGSAFLVNGDYVEIVALRGHDRKLLGHRFHKSDFIASNDVAVIPKILDYRRERGDEEVVALSLPIAESLTAPLSWGGEVFGYLNLDIPEDSQERFTEADKEIVRGLSGIAVAFRGLRETVEREEGLRRKLLLVLVKALDYYDRDTRGHSEGVARYAMKIAEKLGLSDSATRTIYWSALLHDIGKIYVPQSILNKPGRLGPEEYELVKIHPVKSAELLLEVEGLEEIATIVRYHHERWDGKGYPQGLSGEGIPFASRILAVADAFEAMTSERSYKKSLGQEEAQEELKRCRGSQFDPAIVEAMIELLEAGDFL